MLNIPKLCDSRGKESITLFLVAILLAILAFKFLIAGFTFGQFSTEPIGADDFGIAAAAIMAIWLGREWTEKRKPEAKQSD